MDLDDYIELHIDEEPEHLRRLDRDTHVCLVNGRMCSGHLQGRLLKMLTRMVRPRRVLELGTFSGYSALSIAEGLDDGAELHTVEAADELEDFIKGHLADAPEGIREKIRLHFGPALEVMPLIGGDFDMVFIDADKREYPAYYEAVWPLVRPGGYIVADNTLWDGHVADPGRNDAQTVGVKRFNDMVAADRRVEKVIVPLRDGLTIIRKKDTTETTV